MTSILSFLVKPGGAKLKMHAGLGYLHWDLQAMAFVFLIVPLRCSDLDLHITTVLRVQYFEDTKKIEGMLTNNS